MKLDGRFGRFGGCYVPEILVPALEQLEAAFLDAESDPAFQAELGDLLSTYAGRFTSSARICSTAARTRPTRCWPRRCSPGGWARRG